MEKKKNPYYRQAALFMLLNIPITFVVCMPFFMKSVRDHGTPFGVNVLMLASSVIILNLLYYVLMNALSLFRLPRIVMVIITGFTAAFFQLFLIIDYRVFAMFKFHINGLVLNFLTTEGSGDSLSFSTSTYVSLGCMFLGIFGLELFLANKVFSKTREGMGRLRLALVLLLLFAIVVADKGVYAYADMTGRMSVLTNARYYPYYITLKMKSFAARWLHYKPEEWVNVSIKDTGKTLNYPLKPVTFAPGAPKYNVLFLIPDGMRFDMVTPDIMPKLSRFAQDHLVFKDHYSGGNATRFGIFSLMYGLYGNLWHQFLAARQSPVLIDSLKKEGYEFAILSATKLTFPEFRKTVFVNVPDSITDEFPTEDVPTRDRIITDDFLKFLKDRDRTKPFLGFLFYDSTHSMFYSPKEFRKFQPDGSDLDNFDFTKDITPKEIEGFRNRYKNALYYVDTLIDRVIKGLKASGTFDKTIIVITGDHGAEFNEDGYYFHNAAFDDWEVKTALVMSVPGKKHQVITGFTTHLDIVPTILDLLGSTTPAEDYSHGKDLFAPGTTRPPLLCADWGSGALVTDDWRIIMPAESGFGNQRVELRRGSDYKSVDDKERLKSFQPEILETMKGYARFLQ